MPAISDSLGSDSATRNPPLQHQGAAVSPRYRSALMLALLLEFVLLAALALLLSRPPVSPPPEVVELTLPSPEASAPAVTATPAKPAMPSPSPPPAQTISPPRPQSVVPHTDPPPATARPITPPAEVPKVAASEGDPAPPHEAPKSVPAAAPPSTEPAPVQAAREPERTAVPKHEVVPPAPPLADNVDPDVAAAYHARLTAAVQAAFAVPTVAHQMGFKGKVRVEFHLRDGVVSAARVIQSSTLAAVDRAALNAVLSANYPSAPGALQGKDGSYQIWVACY